MVKHFKKDYLLFLLVAIYIFINAVFTYNQVFIFNLLPLVILIAAIVFYRLDWGYLTIIFFTPISLQFIFFFPDSPIDFSIPTEPMLFGMMLILIYKSLLDNKLNPKIFVHPISIAISINLFWIMVTSLTSTMPLVSIKFLLARVWFLAIFYLFAIKVFQEYKNISRFIWIYTLSMTLVIIYSISKQVTLGLFDKDISHFVMKPFFRDHTSYGAVLAFLIFLLSTQFFNINKKAKAFIAPLLLLFFLGLILSYTRAAWLSVIAAVMVLIAILLRIRFKYLLLIGLVLASYLFSERTELLMTLQQNTQDSSGELSEHVKSISNVSTDASNLERINRWVSALRMHEEKPFFGWGPGTYMFKYSSFQLKKHKTIISTNYGDLGNAHSEYIGSLAESGILGVLSFVFIIITCSISSIRLYYRLTNVRLKRIVLGTYLGLVTYFVHGALNNYLDTDKMSSLFWGGMAIIVSIDLYHSNAPEDRISNN